MGLPTNGAIRLNDRRWTKLVALWIPRRFLSSSGCDLVSFIADVNQKIAQRGYVLWNGQILTNPITQEEQIDLIFEGDEPYLPPPARDWGAVQQEHFGLKNPYQMAEDSEEYTSSHIMTRIREPYLAPSERIDAVLDGTRDNRHFYCTCHFADVVHTTFGRLVCMSCGALHAVLERPIIVSAGCLLTAEKWSDLFDEDGNGYDEEIHLDILDFQDIENKPTIWITEQWEESKHEFIFFARSSHEEFEEATRGTEADPSIFLEAGWKPVPMPMPPASQIIDNSIDMDLLENAVHSLQEGIAAYVAAHKDSGRLLDALRDLYTSVELLCKARLQTLTPGELTKRLNTPTVLKRLAAEGVTLLHQDTQTVEQLRLLRNNLQHGDAKFNYRTALSICRKTIVFIDGFVEQELDLWIGDEVRGDDWVQILRIPEVFESASRVVDGRVSDIRKKGADVSMCEQCNRETLVRPHPNTGSSCLFCHTIPIANPEGD